MLILYSGCAVFLTSSVPSSIVVDHLENAAKDPSGHVTSSLTGVAYFYCDYRDQKDQNITGLVGSLLAQFVWQLEVVDIPLEVIASFDGAEKKQSSLEVKEAITMLTAVLHKFQRSFICIDALDELEPTTQRTLLQSLRVLVLQTGSNTSLFLTGRPIVKPEVNQQLCKSPQPLTSRCFNEIEITASVDDIKHFLLHYIEEKDPDPSAMNEVLKKEILDAITEKSDGMYVAKHLYIGHKLTKCQFRFLLPALHIQTILDEPSIGHREDALNTLPNGVRMAYMQTIDRIQRQPKTKANQGITTLYWVSLASRPLSVTEISHALAVRTDSIGKPFDISRVCSNNTLLACCMGLVVIDEETSTLRLVHYSLQEFLRDENAPEVSLFHIHTGHGLIAKTCLTYLRFCQSAPVTRTLGMVASCNCSRSYGSLVTSAVATHMIPLVPDIDDPESILWARACTCQLRFPLFKYASSEWGNHAREGYDTSIGSLAVEWLTAEAAVSCPCAMMHMSVARAKYRLDLGRQDQHNEYSIVGTMPMGRDYRLLQGSSHLTLISPRPSLRVLHCVAYFGETHILQEMTTALGPLELNARDTTGWTPLTWAAIRGHDHCVSLLLNCKGIKVDSLDVWKRTPLIHAAIHGNAKVVRQLLARNGGQRANPSIYDTAGRTAVSYAASRGHCNIIGILLREAEVDPNSTCKEHRTPLMYAIQRKMADAVKTLLSDHRVNPTLEDKYGYTPLHLATEFGEEEVLNLFLGDPRVNPNRKDIHGLTPLAAAAKGGYTEAIKVLLRDPRVDPNHKDNDGHTPLSLAAKHGKWSAVKVLLADSQVDPNHKDCFGCTPLSHTVVEGKWSAFEILLGDPRVDPDRRDVRGLTPLAAAAKGGYTEAVKVLLRDPRVDPNHKDNDGHTPLSLAAKHGKWSAVKLLLADSQVDPNHKDNFSRTPLAVAAKYGYLETVEVLLGDPRVDPNHKDNSGYTTLAVAAKCGHMEAVKALLGDLRVDPNCTDIGGCTPLALAASQGRAGSIKLLLDDPRVEPNHKDNDGYASLALAVIRRETNAINLLLSNTRVDPNCTDISGCTPLALAAKSGDNGAMRMLLDDPFVDPNHKDQDGHAPLAHAILHGHMGPVKLLLGDPRIDLNSMNSAGDTPLFIFIKEPKCCHLNAHGLINMLLADQRVDRNFRDSRGRTVLSYVVVGNTWRSWFSPSPKSIVDLETVESLLEGGADPNIKDNEGKTAFDWAQSVDLDGSDECRGLLRKYM